MPLNRFVPHLLFAAVLVILGVVYLSISWIVSVFLFIAAAIRLTTACRIWRAWR